MRAILSAPYSNLGSWREQTLSSCPAIMTRVNFPVVYSGIPLSALGLLLLGALHPSGSTCVCDYICRKSLNMGVLDGGQ